MSLINLIKYIKFDYGYKNYHFIECWKSNFKVFNIDFEVNNKLDYIKINNLSINNDYYHNNKNEYSKIDRYQILLDNNLIKNINKFYVDIELNKIIVDDAKLLNNDYNHYNYNIEKILNNNEYKKIKKLIFSNLYTYAKYKNINNITMTVNNNKKRYNYELKEEGFNIDYNYQFNYPNNTLNIISKI